jgi:tetratricopeptide (TPR) repeat protein
MATWLFGGAQPVAAQQPPPPSPVVSGADTTKLGTLIRAPQDVTITIAVRDGRGLPIDDLATVRLSSNLRGVHRIQDTKNSADVSFGNLLEGSYEVEVRCEGYRSVQQMIDVNGGSAFFTAYIYLRPMDARTTEAGPPQGVALTPKATSEVDKGLAAMRKRQYESARNHFGKASQMQPSNADVWYLRGTAELSLQQTNAAQRDFEQAVALEPSHEKALLALGQMQLDAGDAKTAIETLNRSFSLNGAGWRTYYLLASAYWKTKQWKEASSAAANSVNLAHNQAATPLLLLGDIQLAAGDSPAAKQTWEKLISTFPKEPRAADAQKRIEQINRGNSMTVAEAAPPALPAIPALVEERPWAPPDIDNKDYPVSAVACNLDDVLDRAMVRVKTQLGNLEKFTATEHIEHQEIDKLGMAGPIKTRQFSYIVFVFPYQNDSVFLEESRDGQANTAAFPTSLATVGLTSLGISMLQPVYRPTFNYQCEGLATVRGDAAWQLRFEEKKDSQSGVRRWQRQGTIYNIPIKGRIWLSTTTFDILRVETDLREPVDKLELAKDHLLVDYGPVKFTSGADSLWLPWSAEMYMELHGKRYHHRHFLTEYMLFGVDTSHKIGLPKNLPPETIEDSDSVPAKPQL